MSRKKWHNLVIQARKGDDKALEELLDLFMPLIYKTSGRIYKLCGKSRSIQEIVNNGKQIFRVLTLVNYTPNGKAHFPHFIKIYLHANLVQMYRPSALERKTSSISLFDNTISTTASPYQEIYDHDRARIIQKVQTFIAKRCTKQEKIIIYGHIGKNIPRHILAKRYHVSKMRMKHVHIKCLHKLRKYLNDIGIKKGDL